MRACDLNGDVANSALIEIVPTNALRFVIGSELAVR